MRRLVVVVLLAARIAHADPDRDDDHPVAASLYLGGAYAAFGSWMYAAWYYQHKPLGYFRWGGDGLFGDRTYAGGADKLGHAWATMALARGGTELLSRYGGFDHLKSSLVSAALADTLFFFVEVKDGFYYEFSYGDFAFDTIGALASVALDNFPRLDEMFDYRVQWWPSTEYVNAVSGGSGATRLNIAEDYSGETFLLAYHLGSIHALRDAEHGTWSRFFDLTVGFDTRGYKPSPPMGYPSYEHHQDLFVGVSFNAQGFFDWLLADRPSCRARRARYISHGLFEVFNLPFSSTYLIDLRNVPSGQVMKGGA
ncbi:MAG: DUF2279 domain-containing protein [Acidobacteriota bacterium]